MTEDNLPIWSQNFAEAEHAATEAKMWARLAQSGIRTGTTRDVKIKSFDDGASFVAFSHETGHTRPVYWTGRAELPE